MTEAQFIAIHLAASNNVNFPNNININYDENTPGIGTVTGFTMTIEALAGSTQIDVLSILEQATKVSFTLNGVLFNLDIISRQQYLLPSPGSSFYYFKVNPIQTFTIASITTPSLSVLTSITPFISPIEFLNSDYNVLFSNATEQRFSAIIQQSDRANTGTIPTNFKALLTDSASKAHVQDSNYSDTGWAGARYNGSKTSALNYGGVSPATTAKYFSAEIYRSGSITSTICSQSLATRVIKTIVHTGKTELPVATQLPTNYTIQSAGGIDIHATRLSYNTTSNASASIDYGNIILVDNEKMRILEKVDPNIIIVERGYVGTVASAHSNNTPIYVVDPIQIIDIDQASTVRMLPVDNSKVWVRDSEVVVMTDKYGIVYDSYSCI